MMTFSERSEYVGANVSPEVKMTLVDHIEQLKNRGEKTSLSKWIDEAIRQRLEQDGVKIIRPEDDLLLGEALPFEETAQ